MRKKLIGFILVLLALSLLTIGIIEAQYSIIGKLYEEMAGVP